MATYQTLRNVSRNAAEALTIYRCVVFDTSGNAALPGAGVFVNGICLESTTTVGEAIGIGLQDGAIVKVEAAAAVTNGDDLMVDATGAVLPAVATNTIVGQAVTAASGAGIIFEMQFINKGVA